MNQYDRQLYHYGVKGMRWGVRRTPQQLGNYTPRKGDVVLKKGTKFQRIATSSNAGFSNGVYMSYKMSDMDLYKGVLGRMRISFILREKGDMTLKEVSMTSKKEVRLPSKEVRLEEFRALAKADPNGVSALINAHQATRYGRNKEYVYDDKYVKRNKKMAYQRFNDALSLGPNSENGKVISDYYRNLSKKGYNAIPDENDIRLGTFKAKAPIIMFDTNTSIGKTKTRDLSASEVFSAYNRSIGKKMVRQAVLKGNLGMESLRPDTIRKSEKYARQLKKDKFELNSRYTLTNLAEDFANNRLTNNQIRKVSSKMDEGKSHEEAVAETIAMGNLAADYLFTKLKI